MTIRNGAGGVRAVFSHGRLTGGLLLLAFLGLLSGCASTGTESALAENGEIADAVPKVEPKSRYGNPKSYVVFGKRYYTKASARGHVEKGMASWYGRKFHGRKTSSGERYNMYAMTAAHKTLPLPSYVQVTNLKNGRRAVVKVNDRGPFHGKRVIDLSYAAAKKLGVVRYGTAMVEVRAIDPSRPVSGSSPENLFADEETGVAAKSRTTPKPVTEEAAKVARKEAPKPAAEPRVQVASAESSADPAPESAPAAAASPRLSASSASVYLQVGAFGSKSNAEQLRRQLVDQLEENVMVRTADGNKAPLYKVHVGPLDSKGTADHISEKLASLGLTKSMVVEE